MIEREFRFSDLPRLVQLQEEGFPDENALYGIQPKELEKLVRKLNRLPLRFVMGFLRLVGRPFFRFPIIEEDGRLVATTMLSFGPQHGYVSMVMVDPAARRKGYARRLLQTAQRWTRRRGKPYIALDVLTNNAPALALYETLGYTKLRGSSALLREAPFEEGSAAAAASIRPFAKKDAGTIRAIAQRSQPPKVAEVLPVRTSDLSGGGWSSRMFSSDAAAWVVDTGTGPRAFVGASVTPVTTAAHLLPPILDPSVTAEEAAALVGTALRWVGAHGAPKVVSVVPAENTAARAALLGAGFRDALAMVTLYRASS